MNRLFFVFVLLVAGVIGLGFYMGWFHLGSDRGGGEDRITLTVDEEKFKEDKKAAAEKVHNLGHKEKDKAGTPAEKSKDPAVAPVPPTQK